MTSFQPTELYGGAISVDLPVGYGDISAIRQVPDNQEVYLDSNGLTSIIFDILERVDEATARTDEEALKYHFHDIVSGSQEETKFWHSGNASLTRMPSTPAYVMFATQHPTAELRPRRAQPDFTAVLLLLVRLKEQKTDIVVTVNVPHVPGEYPQGEVNLPAQKVGPLLDVATAIRQRILETFEVKDFSLFVNEG